MTRSTVGVIGAGRVGSVLAAKLRAAGHPVLVSARSDASVLRVQTLLPPINGHSVEVLDPAEVVRRSDVLMLAVPDDSLVSLAEELAPHVRAGQVVLHTSGRHGTGALEALARRGARPIAFHPAMTFTGTEVDLDRACVFGLTAGPAEKEVAESLVADLGGTPVWIDEADRVTYHAALAHGANHLVTLVSQSMDLLRGVMAEEAGAADPAAVLRPLLGAALSNALDYGDAALTGPVKRGDATTVRAHLDALEDTEVRDTYVALARATADRIGRDFDELAGERIEA
ncbi:DUF2520 domain-containing protein [Aeromicrobium terrae]|uniref:DUF2520 domain-containing protein n=2 Tax=Aeromicrobium terrae TaxID=2498846 RepID=A0A5C8NG30_9ACTN|nr:DUF2520 domain-containing protein [Aeromicrobium terrae]